MSKGDNENALRITGADVSLDRIVAEKISGATSNTEAGDFYGQNAALLATDGAKVSLKNSFVTSNAQNGNGVFSYGKERRSTSKIPSSRLTRIIPAASRRRAADIPKPEI